MLDSIADSINAHAARKGLNIAPAKVRSMAMAAQYFLTRNLEMPSTTEQARKLEPEARKQCLIVCAGWKQWADDAAKQRCEMIIALLKAADQQTAVSTTKWALGPICGWSAGRGGGVYTKSQWRQSV